MSPERKQELRAMLEEATPGPWVVCGGEKWCVIHTDVDGAPREVTGPTATHADMDLIAAAPAAIRELLDEIQTLQNGCCAAPLCTAKAVQWGLCPAHADNSREKHGSVALTNEQLELLVTSAVGALRAIGRVANEWHRLLKKED